MKHVLIDDSFGLAYEPSLKQGSLTFFRCHGLISKGESTTGQRWAKMLIAKLQHRLGGAIMARFRHKYGSWDGQSQVKWERLLSVLYDPDVRGPLSWSEVEALMCEAKDALLTSTGDRDRPWPTSLCEPPNLSQMPLTVCSNDGQQEALVPSDMSASIWVNDGEDASFLAYQLLVKRMKDARDPLQHPPT